MSERHASQTRGFLFADLRDYTHFVELHGDQAAVELLTRYRLLVRDVIARFDGAEIRTEGDSFYVVFSSASAAVEGGLAILKAAAAASGEAGSGAIRVGVGVHAGETAETPEGLVGSAVNLAARICALAGPGEMLVSDTVHGLTRTFLPVRFVPRGRRRLKGIAAPVPVYRVLPQESGTGIATPRAGSRWRSRRSLIAAASAIGLPLVLLAAAALFGVLTGGGLFGGVGSPAPEESQSPGNVLASGDAAESADPNQVLTTDEERLLEKLPAAISQGDCASASVAEGSAGGSASLHCKLPLSADADEVWVDQFSSPETLAGAFRDAVARTRAPPGDCATAPFGHDAWEFPNVQAGRRLCYTEGGAAWLVWTHADDRILVRARRGGGDWEALYLWWRQTAIFLR